MLQLRASLCGDLVRLALTAGAGRLEHQGLLAIAARAALLLDLAAVGWVEQPPAAGGIAVDGIELDRQVLHIDTAPTGCRSADELVDYVVRHPNHSFDHVLRRGRPHLASVADELVREGCWTGHHRTAGLLTSRFDDVAATHFAAYPQRLRRLLTGYAGVEDEREAALAAFADVLGWCGRRDVEEPPSARMLRELRSTGWLGAELVDYVRRIRIRRDMAANTTGGGGDG